MKRSSRLPETSVQLWNTPMWHQSFGSIASPPARVALFNQAKSLKHPSHKTPATPQSSRSVIYLIHSHIRTPIQSTHITHTIMASSSSENPDDKQPRTPTPDPASPPDSKTQPEEQNEPPRVPTPDLKPPSTPPIKSSKEPQDPSPFPPCPGPPPNRPLPPLPTGPPYNN